MKAKVYNRSKEHTEPAEWKRCPRCSGFGSVCTDKKAHCCLCQGNGYLWIATSGSGWTRTKYARLDNSRLY